MFYHTTIPADLKLHLFSFFEHSTMKAS